MKNQVLIIEDEVDVAALLELHLADIDCQSEVSTNGAKGFELARRNAWNLIVLDLQLPGMDGLEICRRLRAMQNDTPVLMLTARSGEMDRVHGLDIGADDYLPKPFSVLEFAARVKALLRRARSLPRQTALDTPANTLRIDDLEIDVDGRQVTRRRKNVALTAREFDLLLHFAQHPGRVYSRAQLLDSVWGLSYQGYEHTVNSHINRLRAKIEPDSHDHSYIKTVWGVGYKFEPAPAPGDA